MIVVVWGVSGCGKTTVGRLLAQRMGCSFFDADDFHPTSNVEKMRAGTALTDDDRWPWLQTIANVLRETLEQGGSAVLACSALKGVYRDALTVDPAVTKFVQLQGGFDVIAERLAQRQHQYMNASLLQSQFDTLEEGEVGLTVSIEQSPEEICDLVSQELGLS